MARPIEELKKLYRVELPDDFPYTEDELWEMLGDPEDMAEESRLNQANLQAYQTVAKELGTAHPREWAVFADGELRAVCASLEDAAKSRDALGLPRSHTLLQYLKSAEDVWRLSIWRP